MAHRLAMQRIGDRLCPADDIQREEFQKIPMNDNVMVEIKKARHPQHHRLFFALLNLTIHNTEDFPSVDLLLTWLKIKLGHVETVIWEEGKTYYVPKSISFTSMDQMEFREFFDRAIDVIVQKYGWDRPALLQEIQNATGIHWKEDR